MAIKLKQDIKKLTGLELMPQILTGLNFIGAPQWLTNLLIAVKTLEAEKEYKVYFSDTKPTRSRAQNKYLWGVVYKTIEDATGHEAEELHEIFKLKFSLRTKFDFGGEITEYPRSTKGFDTKEMTDYIDKIRRWAAERGIHVPEANEIPDEVLITLMP